MIPLNLTSSHPQRSQKKKTELEQTKRHSLSAMIVSINSLFQKETIETITELHNQDLKNLINYIHL